MRARNKCCRGSAGICIELEAAAALNWNMSKNENRNRLH